MDLVPFTEPLVAAPVGPLTIGPVPSGSAAVRLSLILPTYNEAKNIAEMIQRLTRVLAARLQESFEIIVVDDDSPDRTWEVALAAARDNRHLRVIRRMGERGLSTAVIRGWQAARGELLGVIDADLQHPPEALSSLCDQIDAGADLAVASRHVPGGGVGDWSILRRIVSRGAQLIGLVILPGVLGRVSDPMSGYFFVRRSAVEGVALHPLGYKILIEVLGRASIARVGETPYVFAERAGGESKATLKVYLEYLRHLVRLRIATLRRSRFLRYATVGFSGVFVDMFILFALSDPRTLALSLTVSKIAGSESAIINNFLWNDAWTFRDVAAQQTGLRQRLKRFAKFNTICAMGLVLSVLLLDVQVHLLHLNRYLANAVAIALVMAWNFWLNLKLSWRVTEAATPRPCAEPIAIASTAQN